MNLCFSSGYGVGLVVRDRGTDPPSMIVLACLNSVFYLVEHSSAPSFTLRSSVS